MTRRRVRYSRVGPCLVVVLILALDLTTKRWAEAALDPGASSELIGDVLRATLGFNSGVAFGLSVGSATAVTLVVGLLTFEVGLWFAGWLRSGPGLSVWSLGLVLGGACGNLIDRLGDGRVTDFMDVGVGAARWPTFNLADTCIFMGVCGVGWSLLRPTQEAPSSAVGTAA